MSWTKRELKQSFQCFGSQIKYLRKRKGWSQEQLVDASGYSVRLISKAETNGRIALATLVDLAQALSTDEEKVQPEQLIFDPIRIAKYITHATYVLQRDSYDRMRHLIAEDFVLDSLGDPERFPFVGQYVGVEGFRLAIERFYDSMEVPENADFQNAYQYYLCESDENQVAIWGKSSIHPIGNPPDQPFDVTQKVRFRDGQISYFECCYDSNNHSSPPPPG